MGENDEEEVTPEQTDLIVQFSAATGTEDLDQCAANLRVSLRAPPSAQLSLGLS